MRDPSFLEWLFDGRTIGAEREHLVLRLAEVQPAARAGFAPHRAPSATAPTASSTSCSRATPRRRSRWRSSTRWAFVSASVGCIVHEPEPRPDRGLPQVTRALAATLFAALVLIPAAGTHGIKEGGTFRVAVPTGVAFSTIDPALVSSLSEIHYLDPACGNLMAYPSKPLPAGGILRPELAEADPVMSRDGRKYTFTIRRDARFSDGARVTARAFVRGDRTGARSRDEERQCRPGSRSGPGRRRGRAGRQGEDAQRRRRRGQGADPEADEADIRFLEWTQRLCAVPPTPARRPRRGEGAAREPGALLRLRVRARRAPRAGTESLLPGHAPAARRSVRRRSRRGFRRDHQRHRERQDRLQLNRHSRFRGARSRAQATLRRQQGTVLDRAGELPGHVRPQYEPAAVSQQPEAPPGAQLRCRSQGADERAWTNLRRSHRPVPVSVPARLRGRAHLPAQEPRPRQGRGRSPGVIRVVARPSSIRGPTRSMWRRRRYSSRTSTRSASSSRSCSSPVSCSSRSWPRTRGSSTSAAPAGSTRPILPGLSDLFDGRTIGQPGFTNWSYFNSPRYNRLFDEARRLPAGRRAQPRLREAGRRALSRTRRRRFPYRERQRGDVRLRREPAASSSTRGST